LHDDNNDDGEEHEEETSLKVENKICVKEETAIGDRSLMCLLPIATNIIISHYVAQIKNLL
jgi:hypothetical protein